MSKGKILVIGIEDEFTKELLAYLRADGWYVSYAKDTNFAYKQITGQQAGMIMFTGRIENSDPTNVFPELSPGEDHLVYLLSRHSDWYRERTILFTEDPALYDKYKDKLFRVFRRGQDDVSMKSIYEEMLNLIHGRGWREVKSVNT